MGNNVIEANDIIRQIKTILVEEMQLNVVREEIPDDYSLVEGGLALDSILVAELMARIEDQFGLQFGDRVLEAELFTNLSLLADFVAQELLASHSHTQDSPSTEATC